MEHPTLRHLQRKGCGQFGTPASSTSSWISLQVRVLHWALTGQVGSWVRKRPQVHLLPADTVTATKVKVCVPMNREV